MNENRETTPMQEDLFNHQPPAKYPHAPGWSEPTTSKAAAESIKPHLTYQQGRVLDVLRENPAGLIYVEIAEKAQLRESSVCGRVHELVEAKLIEVAKHTRPTDSGRQAKVYRLASEQGR